MSLNHLWGEIRRSALTVVIPTELNKNPEKGHGADDWQLVFLQQSASTTVLTDTTATPNKR